jgi:uncharacterized protein DUF6152
MGIKGTWTIGFLVVAAAALTARPALAHHSFLAEYDPTRRVELTGTVLRVEWTNPHAHFYLAVTDSTGHVTSWNLELGPPGQLTRLGWHRDFLRVGDRVTVVGYLAKDGSRLANASDLRFADGRTVSAGSSGGPQAGDARSLAGGAFTSLSAYRGTSSLPATLQPRRKP